MATEEPSVSISTVRACVDPDTAEFCARTMLRIGVHAERDDAVEHPAFVLLRGYLLAAALMGEDDFAAVGRWVVDLTDPKPFEVLRRHQDKVPADWIDTMVAVRALPDTILNDVLSIVSGALMLAITLSPRS